VLAAHIEGWNTPLEEGKTVAAAIDAYLEHKRYAATYEQQKRNFKNLAYIIGRVKADLGYLFISDISRQVIRDYTSRCRREGYSDGTISKRLKLLTAALNHVRKEGWIDSVPHIDKPPDAPARDRWLTAEQARRFIECCIAPHMKLFALLALHTLSRRGAILDLTWDRVDLENKLIDFNNPDIPLSKKRRIAVPITSKALLAALEEACELACTDYVIEYCGKRVTEPKHGFAKAAKRAGMSWLTPHVLRHTGASLLAQNGVDLFRIAEIMGDTIETTRRHYAKFAPEHMKEATEVLEKLYG